MFHDFLSHNRMCLCWGAYQAAIKPLCVKHLINCRVCLCTISLCNLFGPCKIKITDCGQATKLRQDSCMVLAPSANTYHGNFGVIAWAYHTDVSHSVCSPASADTTLAYISRILFVSGPSFPFPTMWPSILITGTISAAVPVRNISSAM